MLRLALLVGLLVVAGCSGGGSSDPRCPPGFKRFTHPALSLCHPEAWRDGFPPGSVMPPDSRMSWSVLTLHIPDGGMFSVEVMPVSPTDFPLTMPNREEAIDRYAYAIGMVSGLKLRMRLDVAAGAVTEELLNGRWRVHHRIVKGSDVAFSAYEAGKIYESRMPMLVGLTTGLAGDQVVLITQVVPSTSVTSPRTLRTFADVRNTITVAQPGYKH